ncbi:hypothetical protein M422DRAFT_33742 [Sphaerobolus stellatus SS14]|uniref:Aminotransferase class I/classII large domain-containing protein n=1 Tax=Sphaerobolus stellatus (strain SS14) TaxID=990650 RepID=A0A0C9U3K9_SPHS4|nr:hypothetical protein M422DRAFT_33742 [Sphaerobolus stellatus SS14]
MATTAGAALDSLKSPIAFAQRLRTGRALAVDVWSIFNAANLPSDCINLGQGYMNFAPPEWIKQGVFSAVNNVPTNHYSHPKGTPRLRNAISKHYSPSFGRQLNPDSEVIVTSGANEGEYAVFTAYLDPEDEVIMFEPFFDQYLASVTFNSGVPVYVPLHPPSHDKKKPTGDDWTIDFDELRRAITPKTKLIILNTPHNPVGKVFTRDELERYEERRDLFCSYLEKLGLPYTLPQGTYFVLLDIADIDIPEDYVFPSSLDGRGRDFKAAWFIAEQVGVSSIPVSEFYCEEHCTLGERFARFAFCKDLDTLTRAGERLQDLKKYLKQK